MVKFFAYGTMIINGSLKRKSMTDLNKLSKKGMNIADDNTYTCWCYIDAVTCNGEWSGKWDVYTITAITPTSVPTKAPSVTPTQIPTCF